MYFGGFYILYTDPLIVSFLAKGSEDLLLQTNRIVNKHPLQDQIVNLEWFQPKHVLEHVPWWVKPWHRMVRKLIKQNLYSLSGKTHHLIVNASDEEEARQSYFVRGGHFNHNLYVNENTFNITSQIKKYDAVYTAQLLGFKRHYLAKKIQNLMIVSYGGDLHAFCPELKHADFNREFIPRSELAKKYNQSYSGLCLSAEEGTMLASCEYLLCGIPVVSTINKGGRDELFNEQNAITVPPNSEAVAQAVDRWKKKKPDPETLRAETLNKINSWRFAYCDYISRLIQKESGIQVHSEYLMERYFSDPSGISKRFAKWDDLISMNQKDFLAKFVI